MSIHPTALLSVTGKIVGQTEFFNRGKATENYEFKLVKHRLKIDLE